MQRRLTQAFFEAAKAHADDERTFYWDERQPCFGLMVTSTGAKSFVIQYRAGRVSRRMTIKGVLSVDEARKQAKSLLGEAAKGNDPLAERRQKEGKAANTLKFVCEEYMKLEGKKLRTGLARRAELERIVYPALGSRPIDSIKRSDITRVLDKVAAGEIKGKNGKFTEGGAVQADRILAIVRRIFNWHATREDDFRNPIVKGMARTNAKEHERKRILNDDEIRTLWKTAEESGRIFDRYLQFTLLTATRRSEASDISRSEIKGSTWAIPPARYKTGKTLNDDFLIPLSAAATTILEKVPVINGCDYIFTNDGQRPIAGFTKLKADFDRRSGISDWTIHDLRRTARSLMSRARVDADHAERCLGHVIGGVRGIYDRHEYVEEKKEAFEALASQLNFILNPRDNVTSLYAARP